MVMKQLYRALLVSGLISTFTTPSSHAEEIYKRVDDKGVPSFSDTKTEDAEKIVVEPIKIQSVPTAAPPTTISTTTEPDFNYTKLDIVSPTDKTTLRNEPKILLQVAVEPGLRQGHQIEFLDYGQPLQPASSTSSIVLLDFERGTHTLSAQILDNNGKVLKTSLPITVYVFRTAPNSAPVLQPLPQPRPLPQPIQRNP